MKPILISLCVFVLVFKVKADEITGEVTCDDRMTFYADGKELAFRENWRFTSEVSFPDSTVLLAVKCFDWGGKGGIKGLFSNGIKTDSSWKCSTEGPLGWNLWTFDDSDWEDATIQPHNWWGKPENLEGKADWIWTSGDKEDRMVYCRRRLHPRKCNPKRDRLVPDPNNCKRFLQCVHGNYVSMPCAPETGFSRRQQKCEHLRLLPNCN